MKLRGCAVGLVAVFGCQPQVAIDDGAGASTATAGSGTGGGSSGGTSTTGTADAGPTTTTHGGDTTRGASDDTSDDTSATAVNDIGCHNHETSCDVWAQDCPTGQKCVPWGANGAGGLGHGCDQARCAVLDRMPVPVGSPCTLVDVPWSGDDDCELGSYCWPSTPDSLEGTCVAQCAGNPTTPACDDGLTCFVAYDGAVTACVPGCDPQAPDCPAGSVCATREGAPAVCLVPSILVAFGQAENCEAQVGCADGFVCSTATDRIPLCPNSPWPCCAVLCDTEAPTCDAAVPNCTPFEGAPPGLGACLE